MAVWSYQSDHKQLAPAKIKFVVSETLGVLCVVQGLAFQSFVKWMAFPDVGILFGVVGAFLFPFVIWSSFGKSIFASRNK